MRLKGRQARFVVATLGGWTAWRAWMLWPVALGMAGGPVVDRPHVGDIPPPNVTLPRPFEPARAFRERFASAGRAILPATVSSLPIPGSDRVNDASPPVRASSAGEAAIRAPQLMPLETLTGTPPFSEHRTARRQVEASAYLFLRPGGAATGLTPGGTLGASQAAARIAVALNHDGAVRTAVAARLYAPLHAQGAEAALGLDWHPLPAIPLRFSFERRIGLDHAGRDAWSAYAAGGFYKEAGGVVIDGYGQTGAVGVNRRDLFIDGALRAGRRFGRLALGAGLWGAAQPGVERLDAGPRAAVTLPVDRHSLSLVLEARLRLAGHAAPGSGSVLTLVADF